MRRYAVNGRSDALALPTEPVAVSSTWDSDFTSLIPGFGWMTVATHYRVESIDGDLVVDVHAPTRGT